MKSNLFWYKAMLWLRDGYWFIKRSQQQTRRKKSLPFFILFGNFKVSTEIARCSLWTHATIYWKVENYEIFMPKHRHVACLQSCTSVLTRSKKFKKFMRCKNRSDSFMCTHGGKPSCKDKKIYQKLFEMMQKFKRGVSDTCWFYNE